MRTSHIYPIALVIVLIIIGSVAYAKWHSQPTPTTVPSETVSNTATTTDVTPATGSDSGTSAPHESTNPNASGGGSASVGSVASGYTAAQVATHSNASSCWTIINGNVYDLTSWINRHPGGKSPILSLCGHDGTAAFTAQHGGQSRPEAELASFKIGALAR